VTGTPNTHRLERECEFSLDQRVKATRLFRFRVGINNGLLDHGLETPPGKLGAGGSGGAAYGVGWTASPLTFRQAVRLNSVLVRS
jgi:hypothetical protein